MQIIFDRIKKVASSKSSVLIQGESGTGKKLMAQAIHQLSSRNMQKLYSINCRSIPEELLESELFGHIQGAFNGAISDRKGRLELANGSSLFIEEINALPIFIQIKLLKVLQSKMMEPMGGHHGKAIDVRYVVSSLRNLEDEVKNQNFREDLYYRLNVIPINIVPLRERKDDISILISYFLKKYVSADQSNHISFSQKAYQVLLNYDWPGNVRELESLIERLVILKGGTIIRPEDLPGKLYKDNPLSTSLYKNLFQLPDNGIRLKQVLSDIEESLILQAINRTNGNKNKASKLLGLNRTTLIEKLKKRGIQFS
jgi:DNA-binding NtrC family response regulator